MEKVNTRCIPYSGRTKRTLLVCIQLQDIFARATHSALYQYARFLCSRDALGLKAEHCSRQAKRGA